MPTPVPMALSMERRLMPGWTAGSVVWLMSISRSPTVGRLARPTRPLTATGAPRRARPYQLMTSRRSWWCPCGPIRTTLRRGRCSGAPRAHRRRVAAARPGPRRSPRPRAGVAWRRPRRRSRRSCVALVSVVPSTCPLLRSHPAMRSCSIDERPLGAGDLDAARIARVRRRRRLQGAERARRRRPATRRACPRRRWRAARSPPARGRRSRRPAGTAADRRCGCPGSSRRHRRRARACHATPRSGSTPAPRYHFTRASTSSTRPSRPAAMASRASRNAGVQRSWKKMPSDTPARSTAAMAASTRSSVTSSGFSHSTWQPRDGGQRNLVGVHARRAADADEVEGRLVEERRQRRRGDEAVAQRPGRRPWSHWVRTRRRPAGRARPGRPGCACR